MDIQLFWDNYDATRKILLLDRTNEWDDPDEWDYPDEDDNLDGFCECDETGELLVMDTWYEVYDIIPNVNR